MFNSRTIQAIVAFRRLPDEQIEQLYDLVADACLYNEGGQQLMELMDALVEEGLIESPGQDGWPCTECGKLMTPEEAGDVDPSELICDPCGERLFEEQTRPDGFGREFASAEEATADASKYWASTAYYVCELRPGVWVWRADV